MSESSASQARTRRRTVYLESRYRKLERGLPQTIFWCPECKGDRRRRKGCEHCGGRGKLSEESVQELIGRVLLPAYRARTGKFHGAGREDRDVLMLGKGRPFVYEVVGARNPDVDFEEMRQRIHERALGQIELAPFRVVGRSRVAFWKEARFAKQYRAEVALEGEVADARLQELQGWEGDVLQRTPQRVAHRRADLDRKRRVAILGLQRLGGITLEGLAYGLPPGTAIWQGTDPRGILIERCSLVTISNSTIWATGFKTTVRDSTLVATDTLFGDSTPVGGLIVPVETMFVERGTVHLVNSQVFGTNHSISWRGDSGIEVCRGTIHVGGTSIVLGGTTQGGGRWWGVEGSSLVACNPGGAPGSILNLDPRATVNSFGHVSRLTTNIGSVPALRWRLTISGPGLTTTHYTTASSLTLVAAGALNPAGVPTPFGPLHLDPTGLIVLDIGTATSTGLRTWTANLSPNLPLGTTYALQAAELTATLDLHLTNVITVVP